jgi:hypothetical protein
MIWDFPSDSFGGALIPKAFRRHATRTGIQCRHPLLLGYLLRVQESCLRVDWHSSGAEIERISDVLEYSEMAAPLSRESGSGHPH